MNPTDTRERLVCAAFDLFFRKGYKDVSLQDIADAVGVTKGGFFHYFKTKDELFLATMEACYLSFMDGLVADLEKTELPLDEKLELMVKLYYDEFASMMSREGYEAGGMYVLVMDGIRRFVVFKERLADIYRAMEKGLKASIERDKAAGLIRADADAQLFAFEVMSLLEGAFVVRIVGDSGDVRKKIRKILKSICGRIAP